MTYKEQKRTKEEKGEQGERERENERGNFIDFTMSTLEEKRQVVDTWTRTIVALKLRENKGWHEKRIIRLKQLFARLYRYT